MGKVPFRRFITTFLLFGKDISYIQEQINRFGYNIVDDDIEGIFNDIKSSLPEKYSELIAKKGLFDLNNENHSQWLKTFGVYEFYDYIVRQSTKPKEPPEYFKWLGECMWAHGYKDVMCLINILLFNGSPLDEVSSILSFKFKKKMGVNALELYQRIFWDTEGLNAKEALYYCLPFRSNALVVRNIRGGTEFEAIENAANGIGNISDENSDGSDVPFIFHDINYIKWKIGYRDGISVPTSRDFLERVKEDSVFKYYETMNMTQSINVTHEYGHNDKLGAYEATTISRRNVEEQRVNMAKKWVDMHIKAQGSIPAQSNNKEGFFEKMRQLSLEFDDGEGDDKIAHVDDMPGMLEQIKGDMSDI